jgi:hypothetical protein
MQRIENKTEIVATRHAVASVDILPPFAAARSIVGRYVIDAGYIGIAKYRIVYAVDFYFDESGIHAGSPAFVLAGYLATTSQWLAFEERWCSALTEFGVDCFHMHDLEQRTDRFKGWSPETAIALQGKLIEIINHTVMIGICCGVSVADYQAATPAILHPDIRFAYLLCFYECLLGIQHYMEAKEHNEPVKFIFDQNEYCGMLATVYHRLRKDLGSPAWMGGLSCEDRRIFIPLQAADLLAYEMFKHLTHRSVEPWRKMRKSLGALNTSRYMLKRLDKESISRYAQAFINESD